MVNDSQIVFISESSNVFCRGIINSAFWTCKFLPVEKLEKLLSKRLLIPGKFCLALIRDCGFFRTRKVQEEGSSIWQFEKYYQYIKWGFKLKSGVSCFFPLTYFVNSYFVIFFKGSFVPLFYNQQLVIHINCL